MLTRLLAAAGVAACAMTASAQAPQDTPGAEQKNLEYFVGTWTMEGTMKPSSFGPGGAINATETCRMFEGGWHLVCDSSGSGAMGPTKGHTIMTYDRMTKQYRYFAINNMHDAEMATGGKRDNRWTWRSTMTAAGKTLESRYVIVETSPRTHTATWEISEDGGKRWQVVFEAKATRAR